MSEPQAPTKLSPAPRPKSIQIQQSVIVTRSNVGWDVGLDWLGF